MRILFVAASHPESAWLYKALQESAHSLQRADDLRDGAFLATQEPFDAIVLMSLEPASYDGLLAALPQFGEAATGAAIVVVLGQSSAQDRTRMLRAGADACFGQPYSFIEMHERMQALRRNAVSRAAQDLLPAVAAASAALTLDPLTRELVDGQGRLVVTRREYLLLECLMRQPNAPVPRDQLIRYAWPEKDDVDPSSVNLVVSRLRRKLAQHLPDVQIETVSRYGYQIRTG
ncbi:winged helix-turn-helix transcriptional regulator [Paraburkholderia phenazinium]|jgi:two-component system OmpR family response regulator|uniref:DNA-binding response regulator, OmpR family, contains REC and winged-helix (WHTH) domain n=1 Tax=Paraburkholderia phenazinium TaxID=60549 RepID=A0A1G7ZXD9_9BURK|nr:response regulator transcription factor [Paraburkholderia phenazinium]SDH13344.1 DNA-binding response regulator, OmpR family, contains REC and winged-helix (wHTH) domain [Paraburkholderia phenazinium]